MLNQDMMLPAYMSTLKFILLYTANVTLISENNVFVDLIKSDLLICVNNCCKEDHDTENKNQDQYVINKSFYKLNVKTCLLRHYSRHTSIQPKPKTHSFKHTRKRSITLQFTLKYSKFKYSVKIYAKYWQNDDLNKSKFVLIQHTNDRSNKFEFSNQRN